MGPPGFRARICGPGLRAVSTDGKELASCWVAVDDVQPKFDFGSAYVLGDSIRTEPFRSLLIRTASSFSGAKPGGGGGGGEVASAFSGGSA